MAIVKIAATLHSHPSAVLAGNAAVGLWARLACWAAQHNIRSLTVPADLVRKWGTEPQIRRMVASGLAAKVEDGYQLNSELVGYTLGESRPSIPRSLRQRIYDRDGWQCLVCSAVEDLTLDHIHPWSLGGQDTEENLRTLCRSCNSRKGARV